MQIKQRPGKLIFPCKTFDFQHIDKLFALHIVHFAPHILSNKLNFTPRILCNKLKLSSWIQFITQFIPSDYTGITNFACQLHYCYLISTDIAWPVVLACWCSTHQQCGQGISVSAVDLQKLPTARIWDQSNCFPLPVLACSPCRGLRSIAVHNSVACSTFSLPSPSLMPGRLARAVATSVARRPSLQPLASLLATAKVASACELTWGATAHGPGVRRRPRTRIMDSDFKLGFKF